MSDIQTAFVKYLYLDIVSFSKDRSVEAQSKIISVFNRAILDTLDTMRDSYYFKENQFYVPGFFDRLMGLSAWGETKWAIMRRRRLVEPEAYILLPTGDGVCIGVLDVLDPYDIHFKLAFGILEKIHDHNASTSDKMRQFQVRIGINENTDNVVTDVNQRRNLAGLGVNMAQRIMDQADGSQILASQSVFEQLRAREAYMNNFRRFEATGKHGIKFNVYQYINESIKGLNNNTPSTFLPRQNAEPKLSELAASYILCALQNKTFFIGKKGEPELEYTGVILLYYMANELVRQSKASPYSALERWSWGGDNTTIVELFEHYSALEFVIKADFSELIQEIYLDQYRMCFEFVDHVTNYVFVSEQGIERLKNEYPNLWEKLPARDA